MGRILCIDYGMKRCGIATTDPLQIIVSGLDTVLRLELMDFLQSYCGKEAVVKIVFGDPSLLNEGASHMTVQIRNFAKKVEKQFPSIEIDFHDESFTSSHAKQIILQSGKRKKQRRDKSLVDKVSAVLILQDYLGHI